MKLRIPLGGDDPEPKKKVKVTVKKKPYDFDAEMKMAYQKPLKYDNNASAKDVLLAAATAGHVDPSLLMASSWQEGLGKAVLKPDEVSEAYSNAYQKDKDLSSYPVDGFYNYGVDTFGNNYEKLKKYLPADFAEGKNFKYYDAVNELKQPIKTAAFKSNKDALIAKAAFLNMEMDNVGAYAKQKGLDLDDAARKYFTLAAYNSGPGNAQKMLDEYAMAKDKKAYLDQGLTKYRQVHENVSPRVKRLQLASELLGLNAKPPMPTQSSLVPPQTENK